MKVHVDRVKEEHYGKELLKCLDAQEDRDPKKLAVDPEEPAVDAVDAADESSQ